MSQIVLYIACSIDGFIARKDGRLDWLESIPNPDKTDHGYQALLDSVSCIIMGRKTYTEVLGFGIGWPYADKLTYIVTRDVSFKPETPDTLTLSGNIAESVIKMKAETRKDIWLVGGGQIVTWFLNNDLIDKMIISIAPVILGEGIALFPDKPKESGWILSQQTAYSTGIISLTYDKKS